MTALPTAEDDTHPFASVMAFDTTPNLDGLRLTIPELAASPLAVDLNAEPLVVDQFQGVDIPEPPAVVLGLFALAALAVMARVHRQRAATAA